jgi:hypothetical protein
MASSRKANLLESMENGTQTLSIRWMYCAATNEWFKQHHQQSQWYLDSDQHVLYQHSNGTWEQITAQSRACLRFATLATALDKQVRAINGIKAKIRPRFVEITDKSIFLQRTIIKPPI